MYSLGKNARQMPFVFLHFIMAAFLHIKSDIGSGRENRTTTALAFERTKSKQKQNQA